MSYCGAWKQRRKGKADEQAKEGKFAVESSGRIAGHQMALPLARIQAHPERTACRWWRNPRIAARHKRTSRPKNRIEDGLLRVLQTQDALGQMDGRISNLKCTGGDFNSL